MQEGEICSAGKGEGIEKTYPSPASLQEELALQRAVPRTAAGPEVLMACRVQLASACIKPASDWIFTVFVFQFQRLVDHILCENCR